MINVKGPDLWRCVINAEINIFQCVIFVLLIIKGLNTTTDEWKYNDKVVALSSLIWIKNFAFISCFVRYLILEKNSLCFEVIYMDFDKNYYISCKYLYKSYLDISCMWPVCESVIILCGGVQFVFFIKWADVLNHEIELKYYSTTENNLCITLSIGWTYTILVLITIVCKINVSER